MFEQINNDLKEAMKNQDKFRLGVLRMVKSALQLEKINLKKDLEDNDVIAVLKKQVKLRKDSISEFSKYGKDEEVANLKKEIEVINKYLPAEMTEEEIKKVIEEVFAELKPTSIKEMGLVMKTLNPRLPNADMALVSKLVKEKLS